VTGVDHRAYPVLVVDDEPDVLDVIALNYERDFDLRTAPGGAEAIAAIEREPVAVLVTDQRMPGMTGVELIARARTVRPEIVSMILTGYTDVEALVAAINLNGIRRYIAKPFEPQELRDAIRQGIEAFHLERENARLAADNARLVGELARVNERLAQENRFFKEREATASGFAAIIGASPALRRVLELAARVADSPTTVLLEGATGTGKELIARAIHYGGARREKLFAPVNTGAVTETLLASMLFGHRRGAFTGATGDQRGIFEVADGGTVFLDEIGETSPAFQLHLLRVLQEGEITPVGATRPVHVDVRVIAATNRNLEAEVRAGRFREDLFHRLNVFPLRVPSLAERPEDITLLAEHLLVRACRRLQKAVEGLTPETMEALRRHTYRGNVRELENLIERAVILCEPGAPIGPEHLPEPLLGAAEGGTTLQDEVIRFERDRIRDVLAECGGNRTHAAKRLGLTYRGLVMKMHRLGIGDAATAGVKASS
jgi:two-component system, NtrC family, response regulator HupR/HoxA